jgi:hypothetical protein
MRRPPALHGHSSAAAAATVTALIMSITLEAQAHREKRSFLIKSIAIRYAMTSWPTSSCAT